MARQEHVNRLLRGVGTWNCWRKENPGIIPKLSDTDFSGINFSNINLRSAILHFADLSHADLSGADLSGADLSDADLSIAILHFADLSHANLSGVDLSSADLRGANLSSTIIDERTQLDDKWHLIWKIVNEGTKYTDLSGADLSDTNLGGANLSDTNFIRTNLSGANLTAVQALGTNFQSAILTGACIEDWNINDRTNLQDVICEYIFIQYDNKKKQFTDRRPHDPNQVFAPGEFTKRYQIVLETVDLFFNDGIDWKAFLASLQDLQSQYGNELGIQGIEKKAGGSFVVRLEVPSNTDKGAIERQAKELYETKLQILETKYHAELQAKDKEIESYRRENANMMEIAKLLASKPITVEAKAVAESQSNPETYNTTVHGNVGNLANKVQDNARQQTNQHIYASAKKQSLADAAQEIQTLLKQLEQTNPTATEAEQKAFVTAATPPTVRQRAVSALQSGGKAALQEFLDNAYVNVAIAIIEGWRDAEAS